MKYMKTLITKFGDKKILQSILNKDVVAFPTETVYGLGVIYNSKEAFDNLVNVKKPINYPFCFLVNNRIFFYI